jgi:hypothetical protein
VSPRQSKIDQTQALLDAATQALERLGFEAVIECTDGTEPFASFDLGNAWLDITAEVRFK